jgi:acetyl-CoA C-acetyltransferase
MSLEAPLGAIDRDLLNVHGGSLGAGHPFGATGGRIVAGLAKALHERKQDPPAPGRDLGPRRGRTRDHRIMEAVNV